MKNSICFNHTSSSCNFAAMSNFDGFFTCNNNVKNVEGTIIVIVSFLLRLLVIIFK